MAETKTQKLEREYIIPLRNEWLKVPAYRRSGRAIKEIKRFIAKHMKVSDRDVDKVKLDIYLNNEVLSRGKTKPPAKIKVKAVKENDLVTVHLAEPSAHVNFLKAKNERRHKPSEAPKKAPKKEEVKEETEKKIEEKEKELSVAEQNEKIAESDVKAKKHTIKAKEESYHRLALKK